MVADMNNCFSKAARPLPPMPLTVTVMWMVEADESYSVKNRRPADGLIAIRTLSGVGEITAGGKTYSLSQDSLLLLPRSEIHSYKTVQSVWSFYWVEFNAAERLPIGRLWQKPVEEEELVLLRTCFQLLSSSSSNRARQASSLFSALLSGWVDGWEESAGRYPEIELAISRVALTPLQENPTVEELAHACGMSPRSFRTAFRVYTGVPPKDFLLTRKIEAAKELLRSIREEEKI